MNASMSKQLRVAMEHTTAPSRPRPRMRVVALAGRAQEQAQVPQRLHELDTSRRGLLASTAGFALAGLLQQLPAAEAFGTGDPLNYKKDLARRRRKIPEEEFTQGPLGLKYYDIEEGGGAEAKVGERVAVHYDIKWRNITFMTSRQGMGVTGGTPLGFDVGRPAGEAGGTLPGLDYGVRGMRVGGLRRVLVPPELGYGNLQVGEIPPGSTLTLDIELLSIKTNPFGFRTKLVEG